jgi:phosphatidylglycerophosphate synthase
VVVAAASCSATSTTSERFPEVDLFAEISDGQQLARAIRELATAAQVAATSQARLCASRSATPRASCSTPRSYAYLRISPRLRPHVRFCAIPSIRGPHRSEAPDDVLDEARELIAAGVQGARARRRGLDRLGPRHGLELPHLVEALAELEGEHRLRVMYAYPTASPGSCARCCASTARRALPRHPRAARRHAGAARDARAGSGDQVRAILDRLREEVPASRCAPRAARASRRDRRDADELVRFVREYRLGRLGAFTYSPEEGTSGFDLRARSRRRGRARAAHGARGARRGPARGPGGLVGTRDRGPGRRGSDRPRSRAALVRAPPWTRPRSTWSRGVAGCTAPVAAGAACGSRARRGVQPALRSSRSHAMSRGSLRALAQPHHGAALPRLAGAVRDLRALRTPRGEPGGRDPFRCSSLAFWLFIAIALSDVLDGWLARRGNLITAFGRIADPFVDKVLILGCMVYLAVLPWSQRFFPAWVVVVILAREFLVTGIRGYVESLGGQFPADLVRQGEDVHAVLRVRGGHRIVGLRDAGETHGFWTA